MEIYGQSHKFMVPLFVCILVADLVVVRLDVAFQLAVTHFLAYRVHDLLVRNVLLYLVYTLIPGVVLVAVQAWLIAVVQNV